MGKPAPRIPPTDAQIDQICESLRAGNFRSTAAAAAGVDRGRVAHWFEWAKNGDEPYASIVARLVAAEAEAEAHGVKRVRDSNDPRAMTWFLERRFPKNWGEPSKRVDVSGTIALESLDDLKRRMSGDTEPAPAMDGESEPAPETDPSDDG